MSNLVWIDPFKYTAGQPFKIFPVGKFIRGERTLDLTKERLAEMKSNYEAGRPRWKAPIYAGHPTDTQPDPPKLGNVASLELKDDGLYAIPEYNKDGQELIKKESYQYISPGVLWQLAGAKYTDEQGNEFDNVLDHVALTNRPFFGGQTAVFSSDESLMRESNLVTDILTELKTGITELFREFDTETRKKLAESGAAMQDGSYPIENSGDLSNAIHAIGRGKGSHAAIKAHIIKRGKALGKTDMLPEDWKSDGSSNDKESDNMSDTPVVSVDEFAALKAKTENFDKMVADALKRQADEFAEKLDAEKKRADTLENEVGAQRKTNALIELRARAEKMAHLPVKPEEFAEKFYVLTQKDPELAKWFVEKFEELDTIVAQGALFTQFSRQTAPVGVETLDTIARKIVTDEFGGDGKKYKDALIMAGQRRPDLFKSESDVYSPSKRAREVERY